MIGNEPYRLATASSPAERWRCCHSGVREPGPPPRQQQRPGRVLAEAGREHGRSPEPAHDQVLDLLGRGEEQVGKAGRGRRPATRPHPLRPARPRAAGSRSRRPTRSSGRPRPAAPPAATRWPAPRARGPARRTGVRITTRQSPSSSRNRSTTIRRSVGSVAGRLALLGQVAEDVLRRQLVQVVVLEQPPPRPRPPALAAGQVALELAHELAHRPPQLDRPAEPVAVPERDLARHAGRRRDDDPIRPDLLHPPARGPERDHLADAALVDHLLVQLADAPARRARLADEEDGIRARGPGSCRRS